MWGEGIMPIDCLPVGLDCSHEGAVPKCKNIATPISVGAVPSNASARPCKGLRRDGMAETLFP